MSKTKFIIMVGNMSDGYQMVGPFDTFDDASDYDYRMNGGGNWVASMEPPAQPVYNCEGCGAEVGPDETWHGYCEKCIGAAVEAGEIPPPCQAGLVPSCDCPRCCERDAQELESLKS